MATRLPRTGKPIVDAEAFRDALRLAVPGLHARDFLWIGAVRLTDGTRIDEFRHEWTGRRLLLGDDGAAFRLTPTGRYKAIELDTEVRWAIPHRCVWLEMGGYVSFDVGPEPFPEELDEAADRGLAF